MIERDRKIATSTFWVRGALEGFYGPYFTFPERKDLIRFLGRNGFNFYLYGPKNDRQHRMRWWEPYPESVLEQFGDTIHVARLAGVTFCYAISFGVPMNYASREDFDLITQKFRAFFDRGCRSFGVLLDDLADGFAHHDNRRAYTNVAAAHADACNRLYDWARSLDDACSLYLCPTEYHGVSPFGEYVYDLGRRLDLGVDVFYTGRSISPAEISASDVQSFAEAVGRQPLIWDNYPVNDLFTRSEMHIGPLQGRDSRLPEVAKGFVSNLMIQAEASKIPLITIAEYVKNPSSYMPERIWKRALLRIGGNEGFEPLSRFAENSLASPVQAEQAPELTRLASEAMSAVQHGESVSESPAIVALARYLDVLDESCYYLKHRMRNLRLRENLLPWIEALETKVWMVRRAIMTMQLLGKGLDHRPALKLMEETVAEVQGSSKSVGGAEAMGFAAFVTERAREIERSSPPHPDMPASELDPYHSGAQDERSDRPAMTAHSHLRDR